MILRKKTEDHFSKQTYIQMTKSGNAHTEQSSFKNGKSNMLQRNQIATDPLQLIGTSDGSSIQHKK